MKKLWLMILAFILTYFLLAGDAWANHETIPFIRDAVITIPSACPVSPAGLIDKTSTVEVPCRAFIDPDNEDVFWVVIETPAGTAVLCIEVTIKTGVQKIVWRFGEKKV